MEGDEVPHEVGLEETDGHEAIQPEDGGVEAASGQVNDLEMKKGDI